MDKSKWALIGAAVSFLITGYGNILSCRKTQIETENLRLQNERLRQEWRKTQAETKDFVEQGKQLRRDDQEREERSARAWLEVIRTSSNPEDRVLALEWLRSTSPYGSVKQAAQDELRRIREGGDGERLNHEGELLKRNSARDGHGSGHKLQRVEQAQKVLRDLFGAVPPVQRKDAP